MNSQDLNPLMLNPDLVSFELPPLPANPTLPRKRGPARAWPEYRTDWMNYMELEPNANSPFNE